MTGLARRPDELNAMEGVRIHETFYYPPDETPTRSDFPKLTSYRSASCRFDHPPSEAPTNANPFAVANGNRFGALGSGNDMASKDTPNPYNIKQENIRVDLTEERPFWILSSYAPGKDAPQQLFGGYPREQSFEELRLFVATHANQQEALQHIQQLYRQAESQIQATLNDLGGAVQFIVSAENQHPNRLDICKQNSQGPVGSGGSGPFGSGTSSGLTSNPLNTPASAVQNPFSAQKPNPFGTLSSTTTSAFGQPSALGKPGGFGSPAFGQPSIPNAASGSAFGAPSQPSATGGAFGQPSTLGIKSSPFGAPAAASGFAQAAQQPASAFGAPSTLGAKPNPFAQAQSSQPQANPFSAFNGTSQATPANPFAAASSAISAAPDQAMDTAEPPTAAVNPFSQPAAGGFAAPTNPSGFGAPTGSSPFAQPQQPGGSVPADASPYAPDSKKQHPPVSAYSSKDMSGRLTMFKGQPVVYNDEGKPSIRNRDGSSRKIWFPDGAPAYYAGTEPEDPKMYTDEVKAAYATIAQSGRFGGPMPTVPPMREDCTWDF